MVLNSIDPINNTSLSFEWGVLFIMYRLSNGSVVKFVGHVGKNDNDVGNIVGHVGKISIHVGITLEMAEFVRATTAFSVRETL